MYKDRLFACGCAVTDWNVAIATSILTYRCSRCWDSVCICGLVYVGRVLRVITCGHVAPVVERSLLVREAQGSTLCFTSVIVLRWQNQSASAHSQMCTSQFNCVTSWPWVTLLSPHLWLPMAVLCFFYDDGYIIYKLICTIGLICIPSGLTSVVFLYRCEVRTTFWMHSDALFESNMCLITVAAVWWGDAISLKHDAILQSANRWWAARSTDFSCRMIHYMFRIQ